MASSAAPASSEATVCILLRTTTTFHQISDIQRASLNDGTLKYLYAGVTAYCSIIQIRVQSLRLSSVEIDEYLLLRILDHFASFIVPIAEIDDFAHDATRDSRLQELNHRWEKIQDGSDVKKRRFIQQYISLGMSGPTLDKFFKTLVSLQRELSRPYPVDATQWLADEPSPQKNPTEPSYHVWRVAQAVCKALVATMNCSCRPQHEFDARILLATYRRPDVGGATFDDVAFPMMLSISEWWQEAVVHTVKEPVVHFSVEQADGPSKKCIKDNLPSMLVEHLCEPILKSKALQEKDKTNKRLELTVKNGRLYKNRSSDSDFLFAREKEAITLEAILQRGVHSFTEKTRRILALQLSYAVLYFYDTPWLPTSWSSSSVFFFRTATASIPLQPFLQADLNGSLRKNQDGQSFGLGNLDIADVDSSEVDPDDIMKHPCPILVELAIILMEVHGSRPFCDLATKYHVPFEAATPNGRYDAAVKVFEMYKSEMPENLQFHCAVAKCLDPHVWRVGATSNSSIQAIRTKIFEEVVLPLEDDVKLAFGSSVSLDSLDSTAKSLDIGPWVEPKPNIQDRVHEHVSYSSTSSSGPGNATATLSRHAPDHDLPTSPLSGGRKKEVKVSDSAVDDGRNENSVRCYHVWKRRYEDVYEKYIDAHMNSSGFAPVKIALLDTGYDKGHPDFEARKENIGGKYNWLDTEPKNRVHDKNGHGTFIASLLLDFAPHSELYVAKITNDEPSATIVASAIRHAVDEWKVDIVSLSFGFPDCTIDGYKELESAIQYAYSHDVLMFAAASNSGGTQRIAFPARDQNVICIYATDTQGNRCDFSPSAEKHNINLATVGYGVESAWPVSQCDVGKNPSCLTVRNGTSFAAPIAAGIAAFLLLYVRLHLPQQAARSTKQQKMKRLLRELAKKDGDEITRDGYHFIDLSLCSDSLFGKEKHYIDATLESILK
ncbi:hypothetical protein E4U42_003954 [Claviceps africana]|uniref:Peptidase S8/S53 domain-containing protein n=1 Tax=Claviceps africana TaxID=83212 RepID=A0A8K0J8Q3_9HYPO|nr:hypothetical protein E4U42_003954 [Claviceps africana]